MKTYCEICESSLEQTRQQLFWAIQLDMSWLTMPLGLVRQHVFLHLRAQHGSALPRHVSSLVYTQHQHQDSSSRLGRPVPQGTQWPAQTPHNCCHSIRTLQLSEALVNLMIWFWLSKIKSIHHEKRFTELLFNWKMNTFMFIRLWDLEIDKTVPKESLNKLEHVWAVKPSNKSKRKGHKLICEYAVCRLKYCSRQGRNY